MLSARCLCILVREGTYYREQKSVPLPPNHSWMSGYLRKTHFVHFWTTGVWESETGQNVQLLNSAGGIVNLYEYAIQLLIILFHYLFILLSFYLFINLSIYSFSYICIYSFSFRHIFHEIRSFFLFTFSSPQFLFLAFLRVVGENYTTLEINPDINSFKIYLMLMDEELCSIPY